jgi:hypothetical protein
VDECKPLVFGSPQQVGIAADMIRQIIAEGDGPPGPWSKNVKDDMPGGASEVGIAPHLSSQYTCAHSVPVLAHSRSQCTSANSIPVLTAYRCSQCTVACSIPELMM